MCSCCKISTHPRVPWQVPPGSEWREYDEEGGLYGNGHMLNAVIGTDAEAGPAPHHVHLFDEESQTVERNRDEAHD